MVEGTRRQCRQLRCQFGRRHVGGIDEGAEINQTARLFDHRLDDLLAPIAHVDAPQAADAIQITFARDIVDIGALAPGHDKRAILLE